MFFFAQNTYIRFSDHRKNNNSQLSNRLVKNVTQKRLHTIQFADVLHSIAYTARRKTSLRLIDVPSQRDAHGCQV